MIADQSLVLPLCSIPWKAWIYSGIDCAVIGKEAWSVGIGKPGNGYY